MLRMRASRNSPIRSSAGNEECNSHKKSASSGKLARSKPQITQAPLEIAKEWLPQQKGQYRPRKKRSDNSTTHPNRNQFRTEESPKISRLQFKGGGNQNSLPRKPQLRVCARIAITCASANDITPKSDNAVAERALSVGIRKIPTLVVAAHLGRCWLVAPQRGQSCGRTLPKARAIRLASSRCG